MTNNQPNTNNNLYLFYILISLFSSPKTKKRPSRNCGTAFKLKAWFLDKILEQAQKFESHKAQQPKEHFVQDFRYFILFTQKLGKLFQTDLFLIKRLAHYSRITAHFIQLPQFLNRRNPPVSNEF